jgi:hypothetical protein
MTTQELGPGLTQEPDRGASSGLSPEGDALGALFVSSPASAVHTSAAAEIAFLAGLFGALAVPFSLMTALCLGLAALALVTSIVGLARSSRRAVAGGLLASIGLVLSLVILAVVGLRYIGIDTAFGDSIVPTLADWLTALNDLLPKA